MELEKGIELWHKQRNGQLTPEERLLFDQWVSSQEGARISGQLGRLYSVSGNFRSDFQPDTEKALDKLKARMAASKKEATVKPMRPARRAWMAVAASVVVLVGLGLTFLLWRPAAGPEWVVVTTGPGDTLSVLLPDQSRVVLNEHSRLSYPADLGQGELRRVELEGEGFFEVHRNVEKPFEIHSALARVIVLGTRFNFRAYSAENRAEVEVEEGKVALLPAAGDERIELKAGERGIFDPAASRLSVEKPKALNGTYWRNKVLRLRNHTLRETVALFQRHFGVRIDIGSVDYPDCTLSLNIIQSAPEVAVGAIASVFSAKVLRQDAASFVLEGGHCAQ